MVGSGTATRAVRTEGEGSRGVETDNKVSRKGRKERGRRKRESENVCKGEKEESK